MPEPESLRVGLAQSAVRDAATSERQRLPNADDPDHHPATTAGLPHALAIALADTVVGACGGRRRRRR